MWLLSLDEGVLNHEGEKLSSTGRKKNGGGWAREACDRGTI